MAAADVDNFKKSLDPKAKLHHWVVSNNIQTYARKYNPCLGQLSKILKGMAATAIQMENVDDKAFNLKTFLDNQAKGECETITTNMIINNIDTTHLANAATFQFLQTLVNFVPKPAHLQPFLAQYTQDHLHKLEQPTGFKTKISPLALHLPLAHRYSYPK
ncbi:hypothetical protein FA15DRAFT_711145 [Coprinopsis marcescibilis]|uniref:Uncharacterized protein n=1 Tax=Coprinopsis marcescibilis TaxID=230819 RepID=A0A5C3KAF6_COPMA|nr:hypothetical protein FA15DRAFT_711145 [Coprinopsis marcescibilis]